MEGWVYQQKKRTTHRPTCCEKGIRHFNESMIKLFKIVLFQLLADKSFCYKAWIKKASAMQEQRAAALRSCVFLSVIAKVQIYLKVMMLIQERSNKRWQKMGFFFLIQFFHVCWLSSRLILSLNACITFFLAHSRLCNLFEFYKYGTADSDVPCWDVTLIVWTLSAP